MTPPKHQDKKESPQALEGVRFLNDRNHRSKNIFEGILNARLAVGM